MNYVLEPKSDDSGKPVPTLFKIHDNGTREPLGNVDEYEELFDACVERWGNNWDLPKLIVAIRESQID